MKTINKIGLLLFVLAVSMTQVVASSVTFTAGTDTGSKSVIKDGITISVTDGALDGSSYYKVNSGKILTVSCNTTNCDQIVSIEITCQGSGNNDYSPAKFASSGSSFSNGSWTISGTVGTWKRTTSLSWSGTKTTTITFPATSAQVRFTKVVVTYLKKECSYMYYDGNTYRVWKTQDIDAVVPIPPEISGYDNLGGGGGTWCSKEITGCEYYTNNDNGTYAGCYRFHPNNGVGSDDKNFPSGVDVLYPVYMNDSSSCYSTGIRYVECNSPFGTLTAAGGTTVIWSGSNIDKQISLQDKKGNGTVTWSVDNTSIASISNSGKLTIKGTGNNPSANIVVTCHIAEDNANLYCEESKTITITVNAETFTVNYHTTGVTLTTYPTTVTRGVDFGLDIYYNIQSGYKSEGIYAKVCIDTDWCYDTNGTKNIEFVNVSNHLQYVGDDYFTKSVDVYITAQQDVCDEPTMSWTTGTNRTVQYGSAGWTDVATVNTDQEIKYGSIGSCVSVDDNGKVTINSTGNATITATAGKKGTSCEKTISYTVTVECATPATSANESGKELTVTPIPPTSAKIEGGIISDYGGASLNTAHGFVYGTNHNPTLSDNEKGWTDATTRKVGKKWGGLNITNLTPGTTYYARTYVTTDCGGTGYSPTEVSFYIPYQYTITYNENGGTGSISNQTKLENTDITLSDGSGFSYEGMNLLKWNTKADGTGTDYALGATYTSNANLELFAIWTPKQYTVTLDNQEATSAGTQSVKVTMNASTNLTTAITKPQKNGYSFGGYYTARNGGGAQLIGTDGMWIAQAGGGNTYLDATKNWKYADDLVLYAKWDAIEIQLELSANDGDDDGEAIVLFNATNLKENSLKHAQNEGHNLVGYYKETTHNTKVLNSDGSFASTAVADMITDGKWSGTTSPVTLYAFWATEVRTVIFDLQGKGDNFSQEVEYNTYASRPTPDPTHVDYNFIEWYKDAECTTEFDFDTLIKNNTTVYAKWSEKQYENLIVACVDAELSTEDGDPVLVTSRNGLNIMATKKLKLTVSGAIPGHSISISAPNMHFYKRTEDRYVELTGSNSLTAPLTDEPIYVSYNPTSAGDGSISDEAQITVSCDGFTSSFSNLIKTRNLPDQVALVVKVGNTWQALPANINNAATPAPIMVTTKTEGGILKAVGPETVEYKMWSVATTNGRRDRSGTATSDLPSKLFADRLRFAGNSQKGLKANNNKNANTIYNDGQINAVDKYFDDDAGYEWVVTTEERDGQFVYTLRTQQLNNKNELRLWGSKWGTYSDSYGIADIHILPLTVIQTADVAIMEWGTDEVAVRYANASQVASGTFKAQIGDAAQMAVTSTSLGGDIYKLTGVGSLQNNPAKTLVFSMNENGTQKQAMFAIPLIVTSETTEAQLRSYAAGGTGSDKLTEGGNIAKGIDVVIRDGGTLTTGTGAGKFADLYIYPGGKANLSNNIGFSNVYMRGGLSWLDAAKDFRLPQMQVAEGMIIDGIQQTGNGVYYDLYADFEMYYMMALPKTVDTDLLTNEENGDDWDANIKWYDGSKRAGDNPRANCWVWVTGGNLERGKGYEIAVKPRSAGAMNGRTIGILRFPLMQETAWTDEDNCLPDVKAHGMIAYNAGTVTANNVGWNLLGNPYFTGVSKTDESIGADAFAVLELAKTYNNHNWDGTYHWTDQKIKYFTIPRKLEYDYKDYRASAVTLEPFYPFFIQAKQNGVFSFEGTRQLVNPLRRIIAANNVNRELEVDFIITNDYDQDRAGLTISDEYSALFDTEDKEKTMSEGATTLKLYTVMDGYRIAYNSLPENAIQNIPLGYIAPIAGEYTIDLKENADLQYFKSIILVDNEEGIEWDLLSGSYQFLSDAYANGNDTRFVLKLTFKEEEEIIATNLNYESALSAISVFAGQDAIVLHNLPTDAQVWVFDMTGKLVMMNSQMSGNKKNINTEVRSVRITVPTQGIYNIRVITASEGRTIRAIVR